MASCISTPRAKAASLCGPLYMVATNKVFESYKQSVRKPQTLFSMAIKPLYNAIVFHSTCSL